MVYRTATVWFVADLMQSKLLVNNSTIYTEIGYNTNVPEKEIQANLSSARSSSICLDMSSSIPSKSWNIQPNYMIILLEL